MSRLTQQKTRVRLDSADKPSALWFKGRWCCVKELMEVWKDVGRWWEGESEKIFYRIRMESDEVVEVYRCDQKGQWVLYRIYD